MFRYIKLYLHFIQFSISRALQFWFDSLLRIVMDVFYNICAIVFFHTLYIHTDMIGDWTRADALVLVGCYTTIDAVFMTFFAANYWELGILINNGGLDHFITKPVSSLFFVLLRKMELGSFVNTLIAIGILIYALLQHPGHLYPVNLVVGTMLILSGCTLYYFVALIFMLPAFWTHSQNAFNKLFYSIEVTMERPDSIYQGRVRWILFTVIPFAIIASVPARAFTDRLTLAHGLYGLGIAIAFYLLIIFIWRRGLRVYASASS